MALNRRNASGRRRKNANRKKLISQGVESLEQRVLLAADLLDVAQVRWGGTLVDAVRNEYVLRMPQTNAQTATSVLDYQHRTPAVPRGWSLESIGSGFYKLAAPNATTNNLVTWARNNGVQSLNVNAVRRMMETPDDPLYSDAANWAFPQISAEKAWDTGTGTSTTIVAVLDSGIDYNHPDLAGNMWRNPNETPGDGIDNDSNGYVDDVHGINALTGSGNPMDDQGHGTFVAGLIGAVGDNAVGMAGVNWSVGLMGVKIFDANGNTSIAAELRGIQYVLSQKVAGQNIAAANLSFGGVQFIQQELDALNQLAQTGVVLVAAAGNESNDNDVSPRYPANYVIPGLISVAASTPGDALAAFSNYGEVTVDLAAPGVNVLSTRAAQASSANFSPYQGNNDYAVASGTSFAAPLVTGAAALLKSLKRAASAEQIKAAILDGADRVTGLAGEVLTGGRLNVSNAVDLILSTQGVVPVASFTTGESISVLEGSRGYRYADVRVSLDRPPSPGKTVAVWYETRPGGSAVQGVDFVAQSGFLNFSGSEMQKSFRIPIVGDVLPEPNEQFAVRLDAARSRGVTIGDAQTNVVILDDDGPSNPREPGPDNPGVVPLISIDVKREPDPANSGQTRPVPIVEGGLATFVVSLDRTTNKPVTVGYRTNQPTLVPTGMALAGLDYVAVNGSLTFRPGERTKEFTVRILADRLAEANETFHVVLQQPVNAELDGGSGGTASSAVTATITNVAPVIPPQPGFQITLSFPDSSFTTQQQQVFQQAANRWQQIIIGDLPTVVDPATGQAVDDVLIVATAEDIQDSGGNVLAAAQPTDFRAGPRGLPWKGAMVFDTDDLPAMQRDGTLYSVILHEMAHVLGFGSLWQQFGLVRNAGGADPIYVGANALAQYRSIFGLPQASGVPVEATGGQGTAGAHWRESVMVTELMTGFSEPAGTAMPISRITVGAFQDLGYRVNLSAADAYTKPAVRAAVGGSTPTRPLAGGLPAVPATANRSFLVAAESAVSAVPPQAAADRPCVARPASRLAASSVFASLAGGGLLSEKAGLATPGARRAVAAGVQG